MLMHLKGSIIINKMVFDTKMDEQIVTLRVHLLPLYMDNSLLREVFAEYGKVIDVVMLKQAMLTGVELSHSGGGGGFFMKVVNDALGKG